MKGLLHRLAGRATGTALPVRSDARLPFGGTDLAWGETMEADAAPEPLVMTATSHSPPTDGAAQFPGKPVGPDFGPPARETASRTSSQRDESEPGTPILDPQAPTAKPKEPWPPRFHRADAHLTTAVQPGPAVPAGQPEPMLPARSIENRPTELTQAPAEPRHAPALRAPERPAFAPLPDVPLCSDEPLLLMPRTATESVPIAAGRSAGARQLVLPDAATQAASEPNEVHIHIGRIEVTAVREAPAPHARPDQKKSPMSLDAYLAGRSKP